MDTSSAKSRGEHVVMVSLDIKSAFDNAWWPVILNELRQRGVKTNTYRLVRHYLTQRQVSLNYAGEKVSKNRINGCVQGSVCGPLFCNIILDNAFKIILPQGCSIQAFAYDVLLVKEKNARKTSTHNNQNRGITKLNNGN